MKSEESLANCEDDFVNGDYRDWLLYKHESPSLDKSTFLSPTTISAYPSFSSVYTEYLPPDFKEEQLKKRESNRPLCMTSAWRVISFFTVVFVLPTIMISVPLYARYHVYHARTLSFTDGDMRSFHKDVSSFWCQGQKFMSNGTFDAYLTKDLQRSKKKRTSKLSGTLVLTEDDTEEWGIHLIEGSRFTFRSCARWPGGTLIVVRGEENLRRCFYQEAYEEEFKNSKTKRKRPTKGNSTPDPDIKLDDKNDASEVIEGDGVLNKLDLIRRLYSANNYPETSTDFDIIDETTRNSTTEISDSFTDSPNTLEGNEDKRIHVKQGKKATAEPKKNFEKLEKYSDGDETTTPKMEKMKRDIGSTMVRGMNVQSSLSNKENLFFNINDTMDVTAGNSSFSSSEEYLQFCSDTIAFIELTPFLDCADRMSRPAQSNISWSFRVNDTDNYYFIFASDNSIEANIIEFKIVLERRLYNVSKSLERCNNASECELEFSFMKSEGVIVDFNHRTDNISRLDDLNDYHMTVICQPRSLVYTVFILLVPFIIVLFAFR